MLEACRLRARVRIVHKVLSNPEASLYRPVFEGEYGNLLLDGGRVAAHTYIYGTAAQRIGLGTGLNFIALSSDGAASDPADTTLTGELLIDGLARVQGAVLLPTGSGTVSVISYEFTYTGILPQIVQKAALFDALVAGKMAHEILFDAPRTLNLSDSLEVSFLITLT